MVADKSGNYRIRVHDDPSSIDRGAWNGLLAQQSAPTPFMRHEYLAALHDSSSAVEATGWVPQFVTVERTDSGQPDGPAELVAACPAYLKLHSYGEYVFDWAWADAYRRHGLEYYPKLLCAVPFTPVPGTRLMARDRGARQVLVQGLQALMDQAGLSSAHVLFPPLDEPALPERVGWMQRHAVQFHWHNRAGAPYRDFADFLAALQREKRKKIQQERRRVADAVVHFDTKLGREIAETDWDFFYDCYVRTYNAHHSTPYLTRTFFARMAADMPEHWVMFIARREGRAIASSLVAVDRDRAAAWGRYWGAVEYVPCLHFDACYYQPLQWCIANGIGRFEGGAQGEHKMARGLMPAATTSYHRLADERFAGAVADFLRREGRGVEAYTNELAERDPFKPAASPAMR